VTILFATPSSEYFFLKQKTAYEIVDCDWSSDVCSSDLAPLRIAIADQAAGLTPEQSAFLTSYTQGLGRG